MLHAASSGREWRFSPRRHGPSAAVGLATGSPGRAQPYDGQTVGQAALRRTKPPEIRAFSASRWFRRGKSRPGTCPRRALAKVNIRQHPDRHGAPDPASSFFNIPTAPLHRGRELSSAINRAAFPPRPIARASASLLDEASALAPSFGAARNSTKGPHRPKWDPPFFVEYGLCTFRLPLKHVVLCGPCGPPIPTAVSTPSPCYRRGWLAFASIRRFASRRRCGGRAPLSPKPGRLSFSLTWARVSSVFGEGVDGILNDIVAVAVLLRPFSLQGHQFAWAGWRARRRGRGEAPRPIAGRGSPT